MKTLGGVFCGDRVGASMSDVSPDEQPVHDGGLVAEVEHREDAPDECTIAPRDAHSWDRLTRWLSADGDAFVAVEEMR